MSDEGYKFYAIEGKTLSLNDTGNDSLFKNVYCQNDRLWRAFLALTPERYQKMDSYHWDECNNAYIAPKLPYTCDLLEHLHKKSDYA